MMSETGTDRYFDGRALYGDDFNDSQIAAWCADEAEGYADLGAGEANHYKYEYHAWNTLLGFDHLPRSTFQRVLAFGGAYGDELLPIASHIRSVTIVDPSNAFVRDMVHGIPAVYEKPAPSGALAFPNDVFDLITCFGVLHHIPNVSAVLKELVRTLVPSGFLVLREPIVSMGDWRHPRRGLTKHERGIPLPILEDMVRRCRLAVVRRSLCGFPVTERIFRLIRRDVYNSRLFAWIDAHISAVFEWNVNYHAQSLLQRFRPTSVFMILQKPETELLAFDRESLEPR